MEENRFHPRLCGGTFFNLVLRAMKPRSQMRKGYGTGNDGLTEPNCLAGLIKVFYPKYQAGPESTFGPKTTEYKKCELSSGSYLPFDYEQTIRAFHTDVTERYEKPLAAMSAFVDAFVSTDARGEWLVRALIELIMDDDSIGGSDYFYVTADGEPTRKDRIPGLTVVSQQAFMLGVWDYILVSRPDNTVGKETVSHWFKKPQKSGAKAEWRSGIGNGNGRFPAAAAVVSVGAGQEPDEGAGTAEAGPQAPGPSPALPEPAADYTGCLEYAKEKFSRIKTLLYEQPQEFSGLYVCNDVVLQESRGRYGECCHGALRIRNVTVGKIEELTRFAFITGTGGLGKSMMMRHLLLDSIAEYGRSGRVPVLISLKDYGSGDGEIADFVFGRLAEHTAGLTRAEYDRSLANGGYILLLDGLDEINSSVRGQFENRLERFSESFKNVTVIVTSRPYSRFINMTRYSVLTLMPFTKEQALELTDRLEYDPVAKKKFRDELDRSLYDMHRDFAENPLLLTIMLRTYEKFADIPSQIHYFYRNAYSALARDHDATKDLYRRPFATRLSMERFEDYLSEFCALTYTEEKYDLTEIEARSYFNQVREHIAVEAEQGVTAADFMEDLCTNLCIMEHDGDRYYFTHRSFQEYFCAVFLSRQMDEDLEKIGCFFEEADSRSRNDRTFSMLHDMIPDKVEKFIFLPFLSGLLSGGYWEFLGKVYSNGVLLGGGELPDGFSFEPTSFLYCFIAGTNGLRRDVRSFNAPHIPEIVNTEYAYGVSDIDQLLDGNAVGNGPDGYPEKPDTDLMDIDSICREYTDHYGKPDAAGWILAVQPADIGKNVYREIKEIMERPDFPLQQEYRAVTDFYETLKERHCRPKRSLGALFRK